MTEEAMEETTEETTRKVALHYFILYSGLVIGSFPFVTSTA
ncbi:hypothetical protein ES703_86073 [subsurface metagenome]